MWGELHKRMGGCGLGSVLGCRLQDVCQDENELDGMEESS